MSEGNFDTTTTYTIVLDTYNNTAQHITNLYAQHFGLFFGFLAFFEFKCSNTRVLFAAQSSEIFE